MSDAIRPRLSIIIATYNAAATLQRCLDSILSQTYENYELVIIDGGSTDDTIDILRRNSERITYWHSRPDKGIYDAWNQALEHIRGEYVCFLGADDSLHCKNTLRLISSAMSGSEYELVTSRGKIVDSAHFNNYEFGKPWDYTKAQRRMAICHPGSMHRQDLFQRYGKFDITYQISADYDFLLRLPVDTKTLHLDLVTVDVADGGVSRKRRWKMLAERYRAQSSCPRVGRLHAALNYLDKLWRIPVAKVFGIPS